MSYLMDQFPISSGQKPPPSDGNDNFPSDPWAPIYHPNVPFIRELPPLHDGLMINIHGRVNDDPDRFHINLSCGAEYDGNVDTALHLNPRFSEEEVIRTSFINGSWKKEERSSLIAFPFAPGEEYKILILVTDKSFKIAVNGDHMCEFRFYHTIAGNIDEYHFLVVEGDTSVSQVYLKSPQKEDNDEPPTAPPEETEPPYQPPSPNPGEGNPPYYAPPPQGYPPQGYPPQGYPPQGYPPQSYPPQSYPPYGYPPQGYPPQGYPPQGYPPYYGAPPQGYPPHSGYPPSYPQPPGAYPPPPGAYPPPPGSYPPGQPPYQGGYGPPLQDPVEPPPQEPEPEPEPEPEEPEPEPEEPEPEPEEPEPEPEEPEPEPEEPEPEPEEPEPEPEEPEPEPEEPEPEEEEIVGLDLPHDVRFTGPNGMMNKSLSLSAIPSDGGEFTINIKWGESDKDNIALYFHVNMADSVVTMNSWVGSGWAKEIQAEEEFPFAADERFDMTIVCEEECFAIMVNEAEYTRFNHRLKNIKKIKIAIVDGDLKLIDMSS